MNKEVKNSETTAVPVDLSIETSKILAIGRWTEKAMDTKARFAVMKEEVPATVRLYLTGKIELWWVKPDISGVVFVMNVTKIPDAHQLLAALPLGIAGMMEFDFIPLAPISPLRFLLDASEQA